MLILNFCSSNFQCFHERLDQISVDFLRNSSKLTKDPVSEKENLFSILLELYANFYYIDVYKLKKGNHDVEIKIRASS